MDKSHKSNVKQKKTDVKEALWFDSIYMVLKQAKLIHMLLEVTTVVHPGGALGEERRGGVWNTGDVLLLKCVFSL